MRASVRYDARMALPPEFDQPGWRGFDRLDGAVSASQSGLARVLWFVIPPGSIARHRQFQALLASRFLSDFALQALYFAALIATARAGGTPLQAALIGISFLMPGVLLGLFGGAVADALPKRVALAGAYLCMGALCLTIPFIRGTDFTDLLLVLFAVRVLHQVAQPAEAAAAPLVANHEELASANSFLSLASSTGEVAGKALLAPLMVTLWGVDPVVVMSGLLFLLSAFRVFKFRPDRREPVEERDGVRPAVHRYGLGDAISWLLNEPRAFWMLMLAAMASTMNIVLVTLGPEYVSRVLHVDPANTFYVFAPAALGVAIGLVAAPLLIRIFRERLIAILGFALASTGIALLGQIDLVTDRFGWMLLFGVPGVGTNVEMAGSLSLFIGLGMTIAAAATQTYIGRYVPTPIHGRVFAILGTLRDGLAMPQLLVLGAVAAAIGVQNVLTLAPLVLLGTAFALERYSTRWRAPEVSGRFIEPT